jgi:hypothetical protein
MCSEKGQEQDRQISLEGSPVSTTDDTWHIGGERVLVKEQAVVSVYSLDQVQAVRQMLPIIRKFVLRAQFPACKDVLSQRASLMT